MKNSLPVERRMASDCVPILEVKQITGGILDVTVNDDTLIEKTKVYVTTCAFTVLEEDGSQNVYNLELWYQYIDGKWELNEDQSGVID